MPKGTTSVLIAWMFGWASTTVLSAAAWAYDRQLFDGLGATFEVADAVPPAAKITFGGLLLILALFVHVAVRDTGSIAMRLGGLVSVVFAFAVTLVVTPVGYYPDSFGGLESMMDLSSRSFLLQLGTAVIGGFSFWSGLSWRRR